MSTIEELKKAVDGPLSRGQTLIILFKAVDRLLHDQHANHREDQDYRQHCDAESYRTEQSKNLVEDGLLGRLSYLDCGGG